MIYLERNQGKAFPPPGKGTNSKVMNMCKDDNDFSHLLIFRNSFHFTVNVSRDMCLCALNRNPKVFYLADSWVLCGHNEECLFFFSFCTVRQSTVISNQNYESNLGLRRGIWVICPSVHWLVCVPVALTRAAL